jgi:hypothetical protein
MSLLGAIRAKTGFVFVEYPGRKTFPFVTPDGIQEPGTGRQLSDGVDGENPGVNQTLNF